MTDQTISVNKYDTRKKKIDYSKLGERFSLAGNTCHNCKCSLTVQQSHSCKNTEKINSLKKTCNKAFCYNCLSTCYPEFLDSISSPDWKCPCCMNRCQCPSCKKAKSKQQFKRNLMMSQSSDVDTFLMGTYGTNSQGSSDSPKNSEKLNTIISNDSNFDIATFLSSIMKFHKEKYTPNQKPKTDIIPETLFTTYKRQREEYTQAYKEYKENHHISSNINDK